MDGQHANSSSGNHGGPSRIAGRGASAIAMRGKRPVPPSGGRAKLQTAVAVRGRPDNTGIRRGHALKFFRLDQPTHQLSTHNSSQPGPSRGSLLDGGNNLLSRGKYISRHIHYHLTNNLLYHRELVGPTAARSDDGDGRVAPRRREHAHLIHADDIRRARHSPTIQTEAVL